MRLCSIATIVLCVFPAPHWNSIQQRKVTPCRPKNKNSCDDNSLGLSEQQEIEPCVKTSSGTAELERNEKDNKEGSVCLDVYHKMEALNSPITTTQEFFKLPSEEFNFADQEMAEHKEIPPKVALNSEGSDMPSIMITPQLKPSVVQLSQSDQGWEELTTSSQVYIFGWHKFKLPLLFPFIMQSLARLNLTCCKVCHRRCCCVG